MPRTTTGCLRIGVAPRPKEPAVGRRTAFFQKSNFSASLVSKFRFHHYCKNVFDLLCKDKHICFLESGPKYLYKYRTLGPFFSPFKQAEL